MFCFKKVKPMDGERTILHCDMNNFFASVECLNDAAYRGRPVAVCGDPRNRPPRRPGGQGIRPLCRAPRADQRLDRLCAPEHPARTRRQRRPPRAGLECARRGHR